MKSMTGFGRGEYIDSEHRFVVELKSVNHRYQEMSFRIPRSLNFLEDRIRKKIAVFLLRGKIDVSMFWEDYTCSNKNVILNKELALVYFQQLQEVSRHVGLNGHINIHQLVQYPDVLKTEEKSIDFEQIWSKIQLALGEALEKTVAMRQTEGLALIKDLKSRLTLLNEKVLLLKQRMPLISEEYQNRLYARMQEVLKKINVQGSFDETRILQEVAVFAEKVDFAEEIVRLMNHLEYLGENLDNEGASGKKLDFIMQEINRELNTVASKCNDLAVSRVIVEMKSEAEKIREQIQNIE